MIPFALAALLLVGVALGETTPENDTAQFFCMAQKGHDKAAGAATADSPTVGAKRGTTHRPTTSPFALTGKKEAKLTSAEEEELPDFDDETAPPPPDFMKDAKKDMDGDEKMDDKSAASSSSSASSSASSSSGSSAASSSSNSGSAAASSSSTSSSSPPEKKIRGLRAVLNPTFCPKRCKLLKESKGHDRPRETQNKTPAAVVSWFFASSTLPNHTMAVGRRTKSVLGKFIEAHTETHNWTAWSRPWKTTSFW
jgi:hypothetical protein